MHAHTQTHTLRTHTHTLHTHSHAHTFSHTHTERETHTHTTHTHTHYTHTQRETHYTHTERDTHTHYTQRERHAHTHTLLYCDLWCQADVSHSIVKLRFVLIIFPKWMTSLSSVSSWEESSIFNATHTSHKTIQFSLFFKTTLKSWQRAHKPNTHVYSQEL